MAKRGRQIAPWLFLAPFLTVFCTFTAWPLVRSLVLAFSQTYGPQTTIWVGTHNFEQLIVDPFFWKALRNTVVYTGGSLFLQLPVALGLALLLNRPGLRGRALYRLIFFSPSLVGLVFVGVLAALVFEPRTGLLNAGLHAIWSGWSPDFPWLERHVMWALILASLWLYAGYNMIYFLAALQNVSVDLLEAATLDGAGPWARFVHVTLPAIRPVGSFVVLLSVIGSLQLFELPFVLLQGGGPEDRGLTLVMYLYQTGFLTGDLGYASAIGWALALLLVVAAIIQQRLARGEAT